MKFKAVKKSIPVTVESLDKDKKIHTPEGILYANANDDYIIHGIKGEVYPIKKTVFKETYNIYK